MPQTTDLTVDIRLNLEGDWPRSAYRRHCQQHGIEYTEPGYLQWRTVGERLSGRPCFETSVQLASAALAQLGLSMSQVGKAFAEAARMVAEREEERIRNQRAGGGGTAGPAPERSLLRG